jgi:hypothetical protein
VLCRRPPALPLAVPPPLQTPAILPLCPPPAPQSQMQHGKQPCCSLHMQPLNVTMSSSQCRQLQRRFDVRAETSLFAARPLLLWSFQSSQWQLQAVFGPRPSLLRVSAAQSRAFGSLLGAKQRQSLLTCSRLCVTLAARLMCYGTEAHAPSRIR